MEFWFRRKYGLAPADPRFLNATSEDILTEWYAYQALEHPSSEEFSTDEDDFEDEVLDFQRAAASGSDGTLLK